MVEKVKKKEGITMDEADELIKKLKSLISKDNDPEYIDFSEMQIKNLHFSN